MLQRSSIITLGDNSGVGVGRTLGPGRGYRGQVATMGDKTKISVRTSKNASLPKGSVVTALLIQTKKPIKRYGGSSIQFNSNIGILWNVSKDAPRGSRVRCAVPHELRTIDGGSKVVSISTIVV